MIAEKQITEEEGQQAIKSVRRFHELNQSKIIAPAQDAERESIKKFIGTLSLEHADELFACWAAARYEYEPLVEAFGPIIDRITYARRKQMQARAQADLEKMTPEQRAKVQQIQQQAQTIDVPSNVVPLQGNE